MDFLHFLIKRAKEKAFNRKPFNLFEIKKAQSTVTQQEQEVFVPLAEMLSYIKENMIEANPAPIPQEWNTRFRKEFEQLVGKQLSSENFPNAGAQFLERVDNATGSFVHPPDIVDQPEIVSPEKSKEKMLFEKSVQPLVRLFFDNMHRFDLSKGSKNSRGIFKGDEDTAQYVFLDGIIYDLAEPDPGNIDQRINFFVKHPGYFSSLPELISIKEPLIQELNTRFPITDEKGEIIPYYDIKDAFMQTRAGTNYDYEKIKFINSYLKEHVGEQLLNTLADMIRAGDTNLSNWINMSITARAKVQKSRDIERESEFISIDRGDNELQTSLEELISSEPSEPSEVIEDVPVSKTDLLSQINEQEYINLMEPAMKGYLHAILQKSSDLYQGVLDRIYSQVIPTLPAKKAEVLKRVGEEMEAWITLLRSQVGNLIKTEKDGNVSVLSGEGERKYFSSLDGKIKIPMAAANETIKFIEGKMREEGKSDMGSVNEEDIFKYMQEYVDILESRGEKLNWQPKWSDMIKKGPLAKRLNQLGKIKQNILASKQRDPRIILQELRGALDPIYGENEDQKLKFVERTLSHRDLSLTDDWSTWDPTEKGWDKRNLKRMLKQDARVMWKYIYDQVMEDTETGPNASEVLVNLAIPQEDILKGGGTGIAPSGVENLSYTELYYNLAGKKVPPSIVLKRKVNKSYILQRKKEIEDSQTLSPTEKADLLQELEEDRETAKQDMYVVSEYDSNKKEIDKLRDKEKSISDYLKGQERFSVGIDEDRLLFNNENRQNKFDKKTRERRDILDKIAILKKRISEFKEKYPHYANTAFVRMVYAQLLMQHKKICGIVSLLESSSILKYASFEMSNMYNNLNEEVIKFKMLYSLFCH